MYGVINDTNTISNLLNSGRTDRGAHSSIVLKDHHILSNLDASTLKRILKTISDL